MIAPKFTLAAHGEPIEVSIKQNRRSKSLSIRVTYLGEVRLILPPSHSLEYGLKVLQNKEAWVREKIKNFGTTNQQNIRIGIGSQLPLFNKAYVLKTHLRKEVSIDDHYIYINQEDKYLYSLRTFLHKQLDLKIRHYLDKFSKQLGVRYGKISYKDTKTRWGSCASNGNLCFAWKLVFAPETVIEYLVAHEVSHLVEMNHSPRFWKLVETLMPHYKVNRAWLRKYGAQIQKYKF